MSTNYSLLVFDWDGTVMDSTCHIVSSALKAIDDCSLPAIDPKAIRDLIGLSRHEVLRRCYPDISEKQTYELELRYEHHYFRPSKTVVAPFEGVLAVMQRLLDEGYELAVATGKSRRGLEADFELYDLGKFFSASRCGDEGLSKPNPEMLEEILAATGHEPQDALMIGDSEFDLEMGHAANVDCLAVSYGVQSKEDLMLVKPKGCISDISELPAWLENIKKSNA